MKRLAQNSEAPKLNRKVLHLALNTILSTGLAMPGIALAQDQTDDDASEGEEAVLEEVVVTGFARSIKLARDAKMASDLVTDSIMSEDIGKSADENIAEAMSRITGVSLQGSDGIGQTVTIRGLDPNLNNISLNGVQLGSSSDGRDVDLSVYSADMLSQIEIVKTSSADQDEGSLGGAVNLTTARPLDRSYDRRYTGEVQWRSTDFDGGDDYKISAGLSQKFADDRWGIAAIVVSDNQFRRSDLFQTFDWRIERYRDPISLQTGETLPGRVYGAAPRFSSQVVQGLDRENLTANLVVQFQPNDVSDFYLDLSYSQLDLTTDRLTFQEKNWHRNADRPITGAAILDEDIDTYVFQLSERGVGFTQNRHLEEDRDLFTATLGGSIELDKWRFDARINYSDLSQDIPIWRQANFQSPVGRPASEIPLGFSCGFMVDPATNQPVSSGGQVVGRRDMCALLFGSWFDPITHPELGPRLGQVRINARQVNDESTAFYFNGSYEFDFESLKAIDFGIKYSDRTKDRYQQNVGISLNGTEVNPGNSITLDEYGLPFPYSEPWLGDQSAPGQATSWPIPDLNSIFELLYPSGIPAPLPNPIQTWELSEEIAAAFMMARFEGMDGRLVGNLGVRYVDTEVEGIGTSGITFRDPWPTYFPLTEDDCTSIAGNVCFVETPVNDKKSYSEWLPSLNLTYLLKDDMMLRFGLSKTMARPRFDSARPNSNVNIASFTESTASGGNLQLDPLLSNNIDISWEWYFSETGLLSAALFYKDLKDFTFPSVISQQIMNPFTGEPFRDESGGPDINGEFPYADILTTTTVNGASAEILGLELAYQQSFDMLPGAWAGLGMQTNYTYTDSEGDYDEREGAADPYSGYPFINTSEHTVNVAGFWEWDRWQTRLAYNWRSEQLISPAQNQMSTWADPVGSLDFSFNIKINDYLAITGAATNLTDESTRYYQTIAFVTDAQLAGGVEPEGNALSGNVYDGRTNQVNYYGKTYRVGLRFTY